jgi:hypothetical protein
VTTILIHLLDMSIDSVPESRSDILRHKSHKIRGSNISRGSRQGSVRDNRKETGVTDGKLCAALSREPKGAPPDD